MGKKSGPPPPDPRLYDAIDRQVAQGDEMVAFLKESWADNAERLDRNDELNSRVIDQNMRLSQAAEDRANDAYTFYTEKGRPVIEQTLKDAQDYDSAENIANARTRAQTDAQAGFDNAQAQNNRMLARMGVNPNSMKFAALNNQLQMQKAAALAGSGTMAEEGRRAGAIQLRQQAGNLASGMPAQSMGQAGQASQFGGAASGVGAAGMAQRIASQGQFTSGMAQAGSQYGGAANSYNSLYGNQLQGWQAQQSGSAGAMQGLGSLAGMGIAAYGAGLLADGGSVNGKSGGKIAGPGTGISDEVPAVNADNGQRIQLSNGEYIIPADVVRKVGEDKFDQLIQKYHVPAAQQRRGNLGRGA